MRNTLTIFILLGTFISYGQTLNMIPYSCNGKWGYSDTLGNLIVAPEYDSVQLFSQNLAVVQMAGKFGVINLKGEEVLPCKYQEVRSYDQRNECIHVRRNSKWIYFNEKGRRIRKKKFCGTVLYDCVQRGLDRGMAHLYVYEKNEKFGLVKFICNDIRSDSCKEYGELAYDEYLEIGSNILALKSLDKWQFFDYAGKLISKSVYDSINAEVIGRRGIFYYRVTKDKRVGLINLEAVETVKPIYDSINEIDESYYLNPKEWYYSREVLFRVSLQGEKFYINATGLEYTCPRK